MWICNLCKQTQMPEIIRERASGVKHGLQTMTCSKNKSIIRNLKSPFAGPLSTTDRQLQGWKHRSWTRKSAASKAWRLTLVWDHLRDFGEAPSQRSVVHTSLYNSSLSFFSSFAHSVQKTSKNFAVVVQSPSRVRLFASLWTAALQAPLASTPPGACSNSCASSRWCYLTISSSAAPSPPAFNLFQHQGPFQWVNSLHWVAKVLELQLQHQSFSEYSG